MDVLEEWDDKISDELLVNDYSLHPDEWIDVNENENKKNSIKGILDDSFDNVHDFVDDMYERFLQIYWENQRIDFSLFTHDLLADPNDSIQFSIEVLAYQK